MPFRVPNNYEAMSLSTGTVAARDPSEQEVRDYINWLEREQALAWTYINTPEAKKPKPPKTPSNGA